MDEFLFLKFENWVYISTRDAGWGLSRINREDKLPKGSKAKDVNFEYKYDASYETGSGVDIYVLG
jgi:hypothetical protein